MEKTKSFRDTLQSKQSNDKTKTKQKANKSSNQEKGNSSGQATVFFAIATIPLVLVLGNSMLIPVLPDMQKALDVSKFQVSLIITLFSVTAGLFIPILGYLSDRYSRKAIIIPGLIVYGGGGILAGFGSIWDSYAVIFGARIIQGLGAAGTMSMALVGDLYKGATETKVLGLTEASNGVGKVVSPILGSLLALVIWYAAFFAFPVFCLVSLLALIFFVREPKRQQNQENLKKYLQAIWNILRSKGRWLISSFFIGALVLFILFGVLFYLSDLLEGKPYRIDGVWKGFVLAIPLLGLVITSYTTGALIKKNGTVMRWVMNIGMVLAVVSLGCSIFFLKQLVILITLLTVSSIGTGLVLPCLNTMITGSVEKSERGMITSLYSSLRFFGVAFGPPLFSFLMDISDRTMFITVTLLAVAGWIVVFFLIKPEGQVQ